MCPTTVSNILNIAKKHPKWAVCWGLLFHMLELKEKFEPLLKEMTGNKEDKYLADLSDAVLGYVSPEEIRDQPGNKSLMNIVKMVGYVLDPRKTSRPKLAMECSAARKSKKGKGVANDSPKNGYSRDPFKKIVDMYLDDIALAATCYLLRGHALFFCRPRIRRDFNAAKTALNDFQQANQLTWRLYENIGCNHHKHPGTGLDEFLKGTVKGAKDCSGDIPQPGRSPYFIWNLFILCEIERGNIYRQIHYIEEANRYYRQAFGRFDRIEKHDSYESAEVSEWFLSPTLLKGLFERSKVQFDLGQFLDSLLSQIRCLEYLIQISNPSRSPGARVWLSDRLLNVRLFLEAERKLPIYDRDMITCPFGDVLAKPWKSLKSIGGSIPDSLAECIDDGVAAFAREILARMGFTLYTLRRRWIVRPGYGYDAKRDKEEQTKHQQWLKPYFQFSQVWNKKREQKIKGSSLGEYCETLFYEVPETGFKCTRTTEPTSPDAFADNIERKFALQLRLELGSYFGEEDSKYPLSEGGFYKNVLDTTTRNIGNLVTIPRRNQRILMRHGYKHRRAAGDLSKDAVYQGLLTTLSDEPLHGKRSGTNNKFVVLRRWQSFNPKIPRQGTQPLRGGGYFLVWNGRGIVIDPGYDFIKNFYDEGFSLDDVDAIIVTHSHPDHDDDLSTLMTLIKEWNEFHEKIGQQEKTKKLDLFLNESAHRKFSSWLHASSVRVGRIIPLPVLRWDRESGHPGEGPLRGDNVRINLRGDAGDPRKKPYNLELEVVPAWHDDVIGKTSSVGLKFHLYRGQENKPVGILGYTGDTAAYGLDLAARKAEHGVNEQYEDCQLLVAHLGDIKLRELASTIRPQKGRRHLLYNPLHNLLDLWFKDLIMDPRKDKDQRRDPKEIRTTWCHKVRDFLNFITTLDMVPSEALEVRVPMRNQEKQREVLIQEWLGNYLAGKTENDELPKPLKDVFASFLGQVKAKMVANEGLKPDQRNSRSYRWKPDESLPANLVHHRTAYYLLEMLVCCAPLPFKYRYHLGIFGIYHLFKSMIAKCETKGETNGSILSPVFIVGELPEELASYRHMIAYWLNNIKENKNKERQWVYAFTGDIGLHIRLDIENEVQPKIRCLYCNYNNELVCRHQNYHRPEDILETPIKRLGGAMLYLCTIRDHHPENPSYPDHFLSRPDLRII